jgi:23S rRNA (cytidine2498-2'-O)-methyltransferase
VNHLFLHCRAGFEKECAAEISDLSAGLGIYGYSKTKDNSAYVLFITHEPDGAENIIRLLGFRKLIFARQWFACAGMLDDLLITDRVTPLCEAAAALPKTRELIIETVDTNEGKELSGLSKKITAPLEKALRAQQSFVAKSPLRLHLVFITGTQAYIGVSQSRYIEIRRGLASLYSGRRVGYPFGIWHARGGFGRGTRWLDLATGSARHVCGSCRQRPYG